MLIPDGSFPVNVKVYVILLSHSNRRITSVTLQSANQIHGYRFVMPGIDRISELPESLVSQILSHLPTKDSVKTSALSTRWKNQWLKASGIDLTYNDFRHFELEVYMSFIDRFLEFNTESRLRKFKVKSRDLMIAGFTERIRTAINRGIQHLDVESSDFYLETDGDRTYPFTEIMPVNLYTSKTLVSLKLSNSGLRDCGFVSLPCLKSMHLVDVRWVDHMDLEKLLSGCPLLEELTFDTEDEYTLEIDAPELEFLSLREEHFGRIVVKNLTCLFTIDLDVESCLSFSPEDLSKRNEALDLYSKVVGLIPKFNNLSCLEAVFPSSSLQFLPSFLESFPNLKHLILVVLFFKGNHVFELLNVPRCFLSTLECVEIKGIFDWGEEEMKITSYFLENSKVLKKLILSFTGCPQHYSESEIYEEIGKLTKGCGGCDVTIVSEF
ncbi:unnamed protein product [Microthlaspi erraticum]|uniref:F-box domain-containing protein n=1 Tax=Microthlaspi erraticum TaxID=1685480 RepID=A0A6D2ICW3_9BRAS|nr:unnamed protein product [Microthlaspi erraticum]